MTKGAQEQRSSYSWGEAGHCERALHGKLPWRLKDQTAGNPKGCKELDVTE